MAAVDQSELSLHVELKLPASCHRDTSEVLFVGKVTIENTFCCYIGIVSKMYRCRIVMSHPNMWKVKIKLFADNVPRHYFLLHGLHISSRCMLKCMKHIDCSKLMYKLTYLWRQRNRKPCYYTGRITHLPAENHWQQNGVKRWFTTAWGMSRGTCLYCRSSVSRKQWAWCKSDWLPKIHLTVLYVYTL